MDDWLMNWVGFLNDVVMAKFKALSQKFPGGTRENQ
jgi:hypothetical protein